MNRRTELILVVALIILGAAFRVWLLVSAPNMFSSEAESYSKLHLYLQWKNSPLLYPDTNFGPFHMVLLDLPNRLTGSRVLANRIVALAFGILALPLAFSITRKEFGSAAGLGTLAFLSLAALPVKVSAVTLAEGPTLFFLLLGMWLLQTMLESPKTRWSYFLLSAACFAAMSALRFETWLFLPLIALWVLIKRGWRDGFLYGVLLVIFPLVHIGVAWSKIDSPLNFLLISAQISSIHSSLAPLQERAFGFPKALAYTGTPLLPLLGVIGIVFAFIKRQGVLPALLVAPLLALYEYKAIQATLAPELFRYLTVPTGLLALLIAAAPAALLTRTARRKNQTFAAVVMMLVALGMGLWSAKTVFTEKRLLSPNLPVFEMIKQFRKEIGPGDRIFLGMDHHPTIVLESGLDWGNFKIPEYPDNISASPESIRTLFEQWQPTVVLVHATDTVFVKTFAMNDPCGPSHDFFGRNYCKKGSYTNWCWYRLCGNEP